MINLKNKDVEIQDILNDEEGIIAFIIMVIGTLSLLPLQILIYGFVSFKIWNWIIVGIFSISKIRLIEAIGINVALQIVKNKSSRSESKDSSLLKTLVNVYILRPSIILILGWIVSKLI